MNQQVPFWQVINLTNVNAVSDTFYKCYPLQAARKSFRQRKRYSYEDQPGAVTRKNWHIHVFPTRQKATEVQSRQAEPPVIPELPTAQTELVE